MPKMKTNKTASKKFRITKKGRVKRAQAFMSHNTAKKAQKRVRRLKKVVTTESCDTGSVFKMIPYRGK